MPAPIHGLWPSWSAASPLAVLTRGIGSHRRTWPCTSSGRITMNETLTLMFAWPAGMLLGTIFFGGLWWTIRIGLTSKQPALWFFVSLLLRTSIVLVGFLVLARGHWQRLVAGLLGFVAARLIVTW